VTVLPCKDILGKAFSSDEDVQQLVSQLIPISVIFMMGDSIQSTNSGGKLLILFVRQKFIVFLVAELVFLDLDSITPLCSI